MSQIIPACKQEIEANQPEMPSACKKFAGAETVQIVTVLRFPADENFDNRISTRS